MNTVCPQEHFLLETKSMALLMLSNSDVLNGESDHVGLLNALQL